MATPTSTDSLSDSLSLSLSPVNLLAELEGSLTEFEVKSTLRVLALSTLTALEHEIFNPLASALDEVRLDSLL